VLLTIVAEGPPPNVTRVAPERFVPVIVTVAPSPAEVGVKLLIAGGAMKVNPARFAVPPRVVTVTEPLVDPAGTAVTTWVPVLLVITAPGPLPKVIEVAPLRLVPVIVMEVPVAAVVGVKLATVGAGTKVKPAKLLVPPGVVTVTVPLAEPAGTVAVTWLAVFAVTVAAGPPPKVTRVAPARLVPLIATVEPTPPAPGLNPVTFGGGGGAVTTTLRSR
tara:strand:+ start:257 stop:910 length:654 start_codon:yes stop_codon:yes gene_type:complete